MLSYVFAFGDAHVVVDRRCQILRAETIESGDWMDEFRRSPLAKDYVREWPMSEWMTTPVPEVARGERLPSPLHPSAAAAGLSRRFTPAFALAEKARAFDERFDARLRLLLHRGRGPLAGRRHLVERLRETLERSGQGQGAREGLGEGASQGPGEGSGERDALGLLDAALYLLGVALPSGDIRRGAARRWLDASGADADAFDETRDAGESGELRRLAGFGCLLDGELPAAAARSLAAALDVDARLREAYRRHEEIARWLWGPPARPYLAPGGDEGAPAAGAALFPPPRRGEGPRASRANSAESVSAGGDPGGGASAEASGAPAPGDPWPLQRLHALRALLEPAAEGIAIGPRYRTDLAQRFRALLGGTRESLPKGLDLAGEAHRTLAVRPLVTVEPLPELYLRIADAYRVLRVRLAELVGEAVLNELSERGTEVTILDEIAEAEALFRGAWSVAREELGRPVAGDASLAAVKASFRRWQSVSPADPDLRRDLRAIVPLEVDRGRGRIRVRVFAGIETRLLRVEFEKAPDVTVHEAGGRRSSRTSAKLEPVTHRVLEPVVFDCEVARTPGARELRTLCDASKGAAGVREALASR